MDTLKVLTKTRELLYDPTRWYKGGWFACDIHGLNVPPSESKASRWSILGALEKVQGTRSYYGKAYNLLSELCVKRGFNSRCVDVFNSRSTTTHEDLMNLFSEAIAEVLNQQSK